MISRRSLLSGSAAALVAAPIALAAPSPVVIGVDLASGPDRAALYWVGRSGFYIANGDQRVISWSRVDDPKVWA